MKIIEKFATVRGNILMQQPMPSLSNAFRLFTQEERHQELSHITSHTESLAFMADNKRNTENAHRPYNRSGQSGYFNTQKQNTSFSRGQNSGSTGNMKKGSNHFCTHCQISGHSVESCFKIHGYPPNFKGFKDKKMVVSVTSTTENDDSHSDKSPQISVAQYNQLMELLNKQSQPIGTHSNTEHAMLAGKIC